MHAKSLQLCPTLCDPMDCSLPGSSVHVGKLHYQIATMEHSRLDFTAAGTEKRKGQKDHFHKGNILHLSDRFHDKMLCIIWGRILRNMLAYLDF